MLCHQKAGFVAMLLLAACSAGAPKEHRSSSGNQLTNSNIGGAGNSGSAALSSAAVDFNACGPNAPSNFVIAADFNSDGIVDVGASCDNGATGDTFVAVLLGQGAGAFGAPTTFVTSAPADLVAADFDQNGTMDIAGIAADGQGPLGAFLLSGDGSGGFSVSTFATSTDWDGSLVSADFNGDGYPDLAGGTVNDVGVLVGGQPSSVTVLAGPDFHIMTTIQVDMALPQGSGTVTTADFNGDGHPDLAAMTNAGIALLLGDGAGHFGPPAVFAAGGSTFGSPTASDFNADGKTDLATVANDTGTIAIMLGDGQGGLGTPSTFPAISSATNLTAADFDNDGTVDLAAGSWSNTIAVLAGAGDGTFGSPTNLTVTQGAPANVTQADVNGDGVPDLLATDSVSIAVFLSEP